MSDEAAPDFIKTDAGRWETTFTATIAIGRQQTSSGYYDPNRQAPRTISVGPCSTREEATALATAAIAALPRISCEIRSGDDHDRVSRLIDQHVITSVTILESRRDRNGGYPYTVNP